MARQISDRMTGLAAQAGRRLDGLKEYYPPAKQPPMRFEEYLPQAIAYAQQDEKFARQLARALYTSHALGG